MPNLFLEANSVVAVRRICTIYSDSSATPLHRQTLPDTSFIAGETGFRSQEHCQDNSRYGLF
jgi:hypothetical protein